MRLLKKLLNKVLHPRGSLNESTLGQYKRLEQLRNSHQTINLHVNRTHNNYQTLILNINHDDQELIIDDLFPAPAPNEIIKGETVELISQAPDCIFNIYTRMIGRSTESGNTCYRLDLPEDLGQNHNRKSFRLYVDSEQGLKINLGVDDKGLETAKISNLAIDGIKLHFAQDINEKLNNGRFFDQAVIKLPDGYNIDCHIQIRNRYLIRTSVSNSMAGCTLKIPNPQHRNKLEQYLATIQRQQRRRENRAM